MISRSAFLAATVGLLAGCSTSTGGTGFISGDGTITTIDPQKRQAAPILSGTSLEGNPLTATAPGKVVVLNVWGSWCAPCRKEAPELQEAATETGQLASFFGINTRDLDPAPALAFQRSFAIEYPSLYDPTGELLLQFSNDLPPNAIPSTLLIDPQGRLAARIIGATTAGTLEGLITDIHGGR